MNDGQAIAPPDGRRLQALGEMFNLRGRLALVTGASRGLGKAIALALAAAGADVAVNYKEHADRAHQVVKEITALGARADTFRADVSSEDEVRSMVREVNRRLGVIDILVSNAGVARPVEFDTLTVETWDEAIRINLRAAFLVASEVMPSMRQRKWGRIIFITSDAANLGGIVGPHYAASKAGLAGLMHFYAANLAKDGVTVNSISPALVATDMLRDNPRAKPQALPVGRFGTPEEVGLVAVMLACNGFITGQTIHVNGGIYMT